MRQRARLGDYAPPDIVLDIEDAQAAIRDLKAQLRAAGRAVPDDPNDNSRVATTPLRLQSNPELCNRERMIQLDTPRILNIAVGSVRADDIETP
jgi:hypothetical protein